jgi:hypothetical protein
MQATLEFASSNYVAGGAFGVLPSVSSLSPRFTFNNWQDESTTVYTNESIVPSTPMTLHAAFTDLGESSYSLTFDNQGGSGSTPTIPLWDGWPFWTGDYGYPDYFPGDPTYSGYAFGGWWTQTGGSGTRVYFNDTYYYSTFNGSVTLYASWIQLATVNFDVNYFDPNMQASLSFNTIGVLPGTALGSLPTCTSGPRYSFNNWQDSSYTVYDASTTIYSSVDLHASFTDAGASSYSLSFDLQGAYGEISSIPLWDGWAMKSGDYGDANFQTTWMRTNYRFGGWFTGTGGSGTQINNTDIYYYNTYYGSLTVYAYWIALTLSFDLQGGTGDTPTIPLNDGGIWSLDGSFPSDPTLSGYTFGGWFTGTNGTGTQIFDYDTYYYDTYGATVTVYAYWY